MLLVDGGHAAHSSKRHHSQQAQKDHHGQEKISDRNITKSLKEVSLNSPGLQIRVKEYPIHRTLVQNILIPIRNDDIFRCA
jgi:hypothetical protein